MRNREAGLYAAPLQDPANPEAENFTTTTTPLASLDPQAIEDYLAKHPELKDYKLVIIGPPVRGQQADQYKAMTERVLKEMGIDPHVQIIRHPKTLWEKVTNIWPRREDYEKPMLSELKVAGFKVLLAESLSFTVLLVPPILRLQGIEMGEWADSLIQQISLPLGTAVAMCVLDVANVIPLVSFRRALSNHNIRLSPFGRFLRQFGLSVFFSFNFYAVSQAHTWYSYLTQMDPSQFPSDFGQGALQMLQVVLPASVLNMLTRTTVGTSLNIWEQRAENRRFLTSVLEAVTGLLIAPVYILSTMPVLQDVVNTGFVDLNPAHLTMLAIGTAGGAAWASLESRAIGAWFLKTRRKCHQALRSFGEAVFFRKKENLTRQQGNG